VREAVIIEYRAMAEECFKWARGGEKGFPNQQGDDIALQISGPPSFFNGKPSPKRLS
jgi:hypothetical protein